MTVTKYLPSSPYFNTAQTVVSGVPYLDFWNEIILLPSTTDTLISLEPKYQYRADLLSNDIYGTPQLWWVFMLRNPDVIKDPIWDFITGINIYTPAKTNMNGFL